jgi:acetoin utilization deacetylase AcuC-like enzyme
MGEEAEVLRCHPAAYLAKVRRAVPAEGWVALDGDTILSPGSLDAALRAVGGICAAVDAVIAGEA